MMILTTLFQLHVSSTLLVTSASRPSYWTQMVESLLDPFDSPHPGSLQAQGGTRQTVW